MRSEPEIGAKLPPLQPRAMLWYTGPTIAIGLGIIAWSALELPGTALPAGWITLGILSFIAARFELKVAGVDAHLSVSDTFFFAALLLFGPAPAVIMIAIDSLAMSWRLRHRMDQLLFNTASSATALWGAAQVYDALSQAPPMAVVAVAADPRTILSIVVMAAVHFALNSALTCVAVALEVRTNPFRLWVDRFAILSLSYFVSASTAFFLIVTWQSAGVAAVVIVGPLIALVYVAMRSWSGRLDDAERHLASINRLYLSTVGAFSTAIEAKDGCTSQHIHRVRSYALGLAKAMRITEPSTLRAIEAAALLHDTGKLAVPEYILNKPGQLTEDEFELMKLHVDIGADILSSIDFPYPVVPIVRAHHENWDGSGYPGGLRGTEIPIGARILSVVDCFDALTSDRPYRPALPAEVAIKMLSERRGRMYDPDVVDAFAKIYRHITPALEKQPEVHNAIRRIQSSRTTSIAHRAGEATAQPADVNADILAFVSLGRLGSRTPTFNDIGSLVWSQLSSLSPGATLALYSMDRSRTTIVAAFSAGPESARVVNHAITVGERVSGWAAATARAAVNADADLDLSESTPALRYATAVPLQIDQVLVGVMTFYTKLTLPDDSRLKLELIAPHMASLMQLAQRSEQEQPSLAAGAAPRLQLMPRRLVQ